VLPVDILQSSFRKLILTGGGPEVTAAALVIEILFLRVELLEKELHFPEMPTHFVAGLSV
jgi:hypothetical protein